MYHVLKLIFNEFHQGRSNPKCTYCISESFTVINFTRATSSESIVNNPLDGNPVDWSEKSKEKTAGNTSELPACIQTSYDRVFKLPTIKSTIKLSNIK